MNRVTFTFFLLCGCLLATSVDGTRKLSGDKTITKVVKLLQKMLDKSKADADADNDAYAKYKCYVDKNQGEKTASIKQLGEQIELLSSKISELQGRNGELSGMSAGLNADITENKASQKSATDVRKASAKAFAAMESDLTTAIGQMGEAVDILDSLALQQKGSSVQKKKGAALLTMSSKMQAALTGVSALLTAENRQALVSFLEAPLAKGDAIVGVLKGLRDTFKGNLKNARDSEAAEKKAFEGEMSTLESSFQKLDQSLKDKQQEMGENDGELSSKKTSYEEAVKAKAEDEGFLQKLMDMAAKKGKNYEERKMLRANEDAAIAEAVSILNSDDAFTTFGSAAATSTGSTSFLQTRKLRGGTVRQQAEALLSQGNSARLARIAAHLRTGNPFNSVLSEIDSMKKTIAEEGTADQENLDWCNSERKRSNANLEEKKTNIANLNMAIDKVESTINDPKTGLKQQISNDEVSLLENQKAQTDQTQTRKEENSAYHQDVRNLSTAEDILAKAIAVLNRYYDQLDKHMKENKDSTNLIQHSTKDPTPPKTYGDFEGQSKTGASAITMIKFIEKETKKEHAKADSDESTAESEYQSSMKELKTEERDTQNSLIKLRADLTDSEKDLQEKQTDLKDTTGAKDALEQYLEKIKPGCDFITSNFKLREANRATETSALDKSVALIKATPAYKDAVAKDKALAEGKCKAECKYDTTSLNCKVCMAGTTKSAYCKAHVNFPGCA